MLYNMKRKNNDIKIISHLQLSKKKLYLCGLKKETQLDK